MRKSEKAQINIEGWAIVIYLGCILLLLGNILPWSCTYGWDTRDCSVLITYQIRDSIIGILLVIGLLLIPLEVNLLKSPLDYVSWLTFWILIYLLLVPGLYPVYFGPTFYLPLVHVNQNLVGPSFLVMPLSLLIYWLAIRPKNLRKRWRIGVIVGQVALILLTSYFFILWEQRRYQFVHSPSPFPERSIFGVGPLLIIIGAALLLGAEYAEMRRDRVKAVSDEASKAQAASIPPRKLHNVGYWSAIIVTVLSVLPILLALAGNFVPSPRGFDMGVYSLINALNVGLALLLPLSFIVLIFSIHNYAPPEKKVWPRIGLFFAMMYGCIIFFQVIVVPMYPQTYQWVHDIFPRLVQVSAFTIVGYVSIGLAELFTLPVFRKSGIELAIRWCIAILVLFIAIGIIGALMSRNPLPVLSFAIMAKMIDFPVITALLAVMFRRAGKLKSAEGTTSA